MRSFLLNVTNVLYRVQERFWEVPLHDLHVWHRESIEHHRRLSGRHPNVPVPSAEVPVFTCLPRLLPEDNYPALLFFPSSSFVLFIPT